MSSSRNVCSKVRSRHLRADRRHRLRRATPTPWIPNVAGRNDFQGVSFHSASWQPGFDPREKRVFGYPPRRVIPQTRRRRARAGRRLLCHTPGVSPPGSRKVAGPYGCARGGADRHRDRVGSSHHRRYRPPRRRHHLRHRVQDPRSDLRRDAGRRRRTDHPAGLAGRHGAYCGVKKRASG